MEDVNTEAWKCRIENDECYRRQITSLFRELCSHARNLAEYYKHSKSHNSDRFYSAFKVLTEHLQHGIEAGVSRLLAVAYLYDFDPNLPCNGYRSFVKIIHKCCLHLVQLCRHISANRGSLLFRSGHYSKELMAYVTTLGQLRACIYYLQKLLSYCARGELFPDEEKMSEAQFKEAEVLMKEVESLNQECFYGRCLGFQYCESMQKPLMTICIFMASFSDGYLSENSSTVMKVASSLLGGSRYVMDPELRGQKVVEVTRNCDINFCKAFWAMNENDVMHTLPLFVCPPVQLDKVILVPPETFELPTVGDEGTARISPPCAHTGPGPVSCRIISYELREGHETWKFHGASAKPTNPTKLLPRSSGLLIHLHGGGFVAQSSASHEVYLRHWAKELRVPIFCIDYSLAPKQPFPRAFEESVFAYCWALKNVRALGSTGERICLCGDSAGGNLALALAMRVASMDVRVPDGILTTYGCQVVRYTPSPSRLMALMDPLLPLGILSRCLAAYAGMTEETGVNAPMGASITKQSLLEMDEEDELREQQLQREKELQKQAKEFQEQAERLQQQAKKLLEETQRLRIRTSSLNLENLSGNFSNASSNNSPLKSPTSGGMSLPDCREKSQSVIENEAKVHSAVEPSGNHATVGENVAQENSDEAFSHPQTSSIIQRPDSNCGENAVESEAGLTQTPICPANDVESSENPVSFSLPKDSDISAAECSRENDDISCVTVTSSPKGQEPEAELETEEEQPHPSSKASNISGGGVSSTDCVTRQSGSGTHLDTAYEETHKAGHGSDVTTVETAAIDNKTSALCHKVTGSGDSGFHDFVKIEGRSLHGTHTSSCETLPPARDNISPSNDPIFSRGENQAQPMLDTRPSCDLNPESCSDTNISHCEDKNTKVTKNRNVLHLDLDLRETPKIKSPSAPNLLGYGVSGDLLSPDSPSEFYTPVGSMTTPSYAKVRHIAQSPVDQLTHIPISRNPYMSPYLAEADLLRGLPPVYFVCCELDPMLDDSIEMAKRLRDLGNDVHIDVLSDLAHGFLNFSLVSRDAKQGSELCARRIKQILETDDEGIFHVEDVDTAEEYEILDFDKE